MGLCGCIPTPERIFFRVFGYGYRYNNVRRNLLSCWLINGVDVLEGNGTVPTGDVFPLKTRLNPSKCS